MRPCPWQERRIRHNKDRPNARQSPNKNHASRPPPAAPDRGGLASPPSPRSPRRPVAVPCVPPRPGDNGRQGRSATSPVVSRGFSMRSLVPPAVTALLLWCLAACPGPAQDGGPAVRGKPVKEWAEALKHKDPRVRLAAALALRDAGQEAEAAVKPLAEALQDPTVLVRRLAAQT